MVKLFAVIFMLIDHIGMILFPNVIIFRIIGRISMPLFAYSIARGFYYTSTSSKKKWSNYLKRLFVFALISQIPYFFTMKLLGEEILNLNIGFTWLLSVIALRLATIDRSDYSNLKRVRVVSYIPLLFILSLSLCLKVDYGLYGVLFPILFYVLMFRRNKTLVYGDLCLGMTLLLFVYIIQFGMSIQIFSIMAIPFLFIAIKYDNKINLPKGFYYVLYPLHLSVLIILRYLIIN